LRRRYTHRQAKLLIAIAVIAGSISLTLLGLSQLHPVTNDKAVNVVKVQTLAAPIKPNPTVYSFPSRLIIPKLGVDTNIVPMGVTATGNMEAPVTNKATGWYKYGARPGNVGSAVIDGHLGLSSEAVFGKLDQLSVGDTISVIDDQGSTIAFIVKRIATYERDSDATGIFTSQAGSHLNLITCNGDWESHQATYSKRLVVFSDVIAKAI
jgi:sortase A